MKVERMERDARGVRRRSPGGALVGRNVVALALLVWVNLAVWVVALLAFRGDAALLGFAVMAYGFGLRHAVDADHIAAIDSATRKLMRAGQRPAFAGLFFSLGHTLLLTMATAAIVGAELRLGPRFASWNAVAGFAGTLVSALFLFAMAAMNLLIARSVHEALRRVRAGGQHDEDGIDTLLDGRGLMARLLRPLFRLIGRSWHMLLVGFLFGLGFDTATEVGLLGMGGAAAAQGVSPWAIMLLPALFAAGMALLDTADGMLMLAAYGWAGARPLRRLRYNFAVTIVSAGIAFAIAVAEMLNLLGQGFGLTGPVWRGLDSVTQNWFGTIGVGIVVLFLFMLLVAAWGRGRRDEAAEPRAGA